MNEGIQVNIELTHKNLFPKNNFIHRSRNEMKLFPIINSNEYLNTLNYYRNKDKIKNNRRIFFTNEEINSHFNNDQIKSKKKILLNKPKKNETFNINTINATNFLKNKSFKKQFNNKLIFNVQTNVDAISHVNSNLSISKVNFNISNTYSNEQDPYKLIEIKNKIKKIRFQAYNKYNINRRNKLKLKKSYSSEKKIELDSNFNIKINKCIKPKDYFYFFNSNKNKKNNIKYKDEKSQIENKMKNNKKFKIIRGLTGNNLLENIANRLEKSSNIKIKLHNILQRTNSKLLKHT